MKDLKLLIICKKYLEKSFLLENDFKNFKIDLNYVNWIKDYSIFKIKTNNLIKKYLEISYLSQIAERVLLNLNIFQNLDINNLEKELVSLEFFPFLKEFFLNVKVVGDFQKDYRVNLTKKITSYLKNNKNLKFKYSSNNLYFVFKKNEQDDKYSLNIAIDLLNLNLTKRDYRVFVTPKNEDLDLAYSAFLNTYNQYLKNKKNDKNVLNILDPKINDGSTILEIAHHLYAQSINFFKKESFDNELIRNFLSYLKLDFDIIKFLEKIDDKFVEKNIDKFAIKGYDNVLGSIYTAQKNAKVCEMFLKINLSRQDFQFLDFKEKETIDFFFINLSLLKFEDFQKNFEIFLETLNKKESYFTIIVNNNFENYEKKIDLLFNENFLENLKFDLILKNKNKKDGKGFFIYYIFK